MSFVRSGIVIVAALLAASCSRLETAEQRAERTGLDTPASLALDAPVGDVTPTLRLALVRPATWDPIAISMSDQDAVIVADLLFDGLTEATPDGRLVPALATGWSSTEDHYAWTFALDEERVTAERVRASFERLRNEGPSSPAATLLSTVARVDVVDPGTVRFVLNSPNAGFDWIVSGLAFSITDAVGSTSGRYVLAEDGVERSVLVSDDVAEPTSVIVEWMADHESAEAAADAGKADGAVVPIGEGDRAARKVGVASQARSITRFFVLDPTAPALVDLRVRQALLLAVDPRALADVVASPAFTADGLVAPTSAGFVGDACGPSCGFDIERAKALLAEVGGTSVVRIGFSNEQERLLAESIVEHLSLVGLEAQSIEIVDGQLSLALAESRVDAFPYGWLAPAGSIDAVLPPLLSTSSPANAIGSISPMIDDLMTEALRTNDDTGRWTLLQSAHRMALEEAVFLPVAAAENRFVVSPAFTDVVTRADGSIEIRSLP